MPFVDLSEVTIDQKNWLDEADKVGDKYSLPKGLYRELIRQESQGNPDVKSPKGAIGLAQLMPSTASMLKVNPSNPEENLEGGARYLSDMLKRFGGDVSLALAAYNSGPERVKRYNGVPPIAETQDYVKKITDRMTSQYGTGGNFVSMKEVKVDDPSTTGGKFVDVKNIKIDEPEQQGGSGNSLLDATGIPRLVKHYQNEVASGREAMGQFAEKPSGRTALTGAAGLVQYLFSPLTAVAKTIGRDPAEAGAKMLGASEGVTRFVGDLGEGAIGMVPYGGLVKNAIIKSNEALKAAEAAKLVKQKIPSYREYLNEGESPLQYAEGTTQEVIDKTMNTAKTLGERANLADDVISAAKANIQPTGKRIGQEVINYISQNREEIPKVLEKYGMTPEELSAEFKAVHSEAGRSLWRLSNLAKQVKKEYATNPELQKFANALEQGLPEPTFFDRFMGGFKSTENFRKATLTAQPATTFRNIISQAGRFTVGSIDDAFGGAIRGAINGQPIKQTGEDVLKGLGEGLDLISATFSRMTPTGKKALTDILDADNALKAKSMLYGAPVQDVTLGNKVTKALQTLNTTQEFFFRNIAFEAKLEQLMNKAGIKGGIKAVKPNEIPEELLEQAANYSLEMTFSSMPKSTAGKELLKVASHPVMTALFNPFPRFMWANALPFLKDFSPLGFVKAVSPKTMAKLASGNSDEFAQAASRATIGTMMFSGAVHLRNSEYAGNNWYELKVGDKNIDTRAFAPLSSYLFLAEAVTHPDRIKPSDFASALLSLNRVAGTGLVMTDIIRGKSLDTVNNAINRLAGEYAGSFTTPLRFPKDIYSKIDNKESIIRDVRETELIGPTMRNIPVVSQRLPEAVSPLQTGPMKSETPLLRQTTGITYKTKNAVEDELERINFDMGKAYPRTGIAEADRKIATIMQPIVQEGASRLMNNQKYQAMPEEAKRLLWGKAFQMIRTLSKTKLATENQELIRKVILKGMDEDLKRLLGDRIAQQQGGE